jgi:alanyl aminopeptidase
MCVAVPKGKSVANQCFLFDGASKRVPLEAAGCPAWVDGNAGGRGYYRVRYARDLGTKLLKAGAIDAVSRAAALYNMRALVDAGHQPMSSMLAVMPDISRDKNPELVEVALELAASIERYVETPQYAAYRRFLGRSFAAPARAAGWKPKKGESATTATMRPRLLTVAGVMAQDPALIADAKKLAAAYLKAPDSLDPELATVVLATATHGGDTALAGQLDAAFAKTQDHRVRGALLAGMVLSTDPAVRAKAIARMGDHSLTLEELITVVMTAALDRTSRDETYAFILAHFDDVMASLPFLVRPAMVRFSGFYCDAQHRGELDTIFKPKVKDIPGGAKELGEATEAMDVCIAKKAAAGPDIAKFLAN